MTNEKTYLLMDLQDCTDYRECTLEEIKEWYIYVMEDAPEFAHLEEEDLKWQNFKKRVEGASFDLLQDMLQYGIEYTIMNDERERLEWMLEVELLTQEEYERAIEEGAQNE